MNRLQAHLRQALPHPLARRLTLVIAVKLALLWLLIHLASALFSASHDATPAVEERVFGLSTSIAPASPAIEEPY